jgi:hypothetical protein
MDLAQTRKELAWRLHILNWLLIATCAAVFVLCLAFGSFSVVPLSLAKPLAMAAAFVLIANTYARVNRREAFGHYAFASAAQMTLVASLMALLSYMAASSDLPMQDGNLSRLDAMLGLDWPAYFRFVYERPEMITLGYLGYAMIVWPPFFAPLVLSAKAEYLRLQQFVFACVATLVLTIVISALVPALGTFQQYGIEYDSSVFVPGGYLEQLRDLPQVRSGALRVLDLGKLGGIAAFPSFHAAAAILFTWAFWPVWWMRPIVLMTQGLMLFVTPIFGGHYFVDVFAGLTVAMIGIAMGRRVTRRLSVRAGAHAHPELALPKRHDVRAEADQ